MAKLRVRMWLASRKWQLVCDDDRRLLRGFQMAACLVTNLVPPHMVMGMISGTALLLQC